MNLLLMIYASLLTIIIIWAMYKGVKARKHFLRIGGLHSWQKSWLDFLILFWILIVSFIASPILVGKISSYWIEAYAESTYYLFGVALAGHLISLIIFLTTLNKGKNILDWGCLDRKGTSWIEGFRQGGFLFLMSYPSMILVAILWESFLSWMINLGWIGSAPHQEALSVLMGLESPAEIVLFIVLAVVCAPVLEELLFRGVLFRFLVSQWGFWAAALSSGLSFAIIHYNWFALVSLWWVGFLLAWVYWKTSSIKTAIVFHACFNANTCILVLLGAEELL